MLERFDLGSDVQDVSPLEIDLVRHTPIVLQFRRPCLPLMTYELRFAAARIIPFTVGDSSKGRSRQAPFRR